MGKLDYYTETQSNGSYALALAKEAAKLANVGYQHKLRYDEAEAALTWWRRIMISSPIVLHNVLFVIFLVSDFIFSWEIFRVLVESAGLVLSNNPFWSNAAIFVLCLLINGWAVMTARFIAKGWSSDVQAWERWNYIFIKKTQAPPSLIDKYMDEEFRRARWLAFGSGILLLLLVAMTAYLRQQLVTEEEDRQTFLGQVLLVLPVAIILGEFLTGDYVWYSLRWLFMRRRRQVEYENFMAYKEACSRLDTEAVEYASKAERHNESFEESGDLERSKMRHRLRSAQDDNYLNPNFGKIEFNIRNSDLTPGAKIAIFGILPNGAKTGDFCTDQNGKAVLYWNGEWDHLVSVRIENRDYLGPFQTYSEHFIDLADPLKERKPCA